MAYPSVSDTAKKRIANLKKTGGIPPKPPKPPPPNGMNQSSRAIKDRSIYEDSEYGFKRGRK
jgi:hypothetical protein